MKIELDLPVPEGWKYKSDNYTLLGKTLQSLWVKGEITFERIEPVDHELEEAKKLIGKWVKNGRGDMAIKVANVYKNHRGEILYESKGYSVTLEHWDPFPLPTWRCCESDRPKIPYNYWLRLKGHHHLGCRLSCYWDAEKQHWSALPLGDKAEYYEWLDEGGE